MTLRVSSSIAIALLALASGCSDHRRAQPPTTCSPTPQTVSDPTAAQGYCTDFYAALCDRSFSDCPDIGLGEVLSDVEACRAQTAAMCASSDYSNDWYDGPCASVCIGFLRGADCFVLLTSSEPQACTAATGSFPPDCISTITPGTFGDTITAADPSYEGGHARTWCIALTAGQAVTIQTSTPAASPIVDTVLHLLGPSGAQLAEDDDSAGALQARIVQTIPATGTHKIVVRGYAASDTGAYDLTVTASPPP